MLAMSLLATYGDGLADINIKEKLKFHEKHGKFMTITSQPGGRFGALTWTKQSGG